MTGPTFLKLILLIQVDKFQAILALGTQGGVEETYLIYLYESVGNVPDVNPKKVRMDK